MSVEPDDPVDMTGGALLPEIDFTRLDRAVIAISGGSDSTALLMLIKDRVAKCGAKTDLLAVTVDHGLRKDAANEARKVANFCASIGIAHKTVRWERSEPLKSGVAAAARAARYSLLAKVADDFGSQVIFTGHTLDDQIETIAMRRTRGKGRGLAGIAPLTLYDGHVWIARPLLGARRAQLRSFLEKRQAMWIEDPSNVDIRNERARVRKMLASQPAVHARKLFEACREARGQRIAQSNGAAGIVAKHARLAAPGLIEIDWQAVSGNVMGAITALRALIAIIGGRTQFPDLVRAETLAGKLKSGNWRGSLAGCVIERLGGAVYVWREFRGSGPQPVQAIPGTIWDGRWLLKAKADLAGAQIAPLGKHGKLPPCQTGNPPRNRIRRAAAAALPTLVTDVCGGEAEAAEFDAEKFEPVAAPWREFLPVFDLALARAMQKLLCGARLPEIPAALKKLLPI